MQDSGFGVTRRGGNRYAETMLETGQSLVGLGVYTPSEAACLVGIGTAGLTRWLGGYVGGGKRYAPLWQTEIQLDDGKVYLGFRDLLEARVAARFSEHGVSTQRIRRAIEIARDVVGERPLSTTWLKTDGHTVFLQIAREAGDKAEPALLDLFKRQYAFGAVVEQSLCDIEFHGALPRAWWPQGRQAGIVIDPARSFGQPIEAESSVPAAILAQAARSEGSAEAAAAAWQVPLRAVRRATLFQDRLILKKAA